MFHKQSAREDIKEWIDSLKAKTKNDFFTPQGPSQKSNSSNTGQSCSEVVISH